MIRISVAAILSLLFSAGSALAAGEIRLWASVTGQQQIFNQITAPFEKATGIKIVAVGDPTSKSSVEFFMDVLNGKAEAATTSLPYEDWVGLLKTEKIEHPEIKNITHRVIGRDLMEVFANKANGVAKLSLEQIGSVFSGKITNWKELGGKDLPVKIVVQRGKKATIKSFSSLTMNNREYGKSLDVLDHKESAALVGKTPGAIGFGPTGTIKDGVVRVETPPIGRPLTLINRGKPSENLQKLIFFIRDEGPKYGVGKK